MVYLNNNTEVQLVSIPRGTVLPSSSVTQYATEEYVDEAIAEAISGITTYEAGENIQIVNDVISVTGMPDTSEFVTSGEVQTQIDTAISGLSPYTAGTYIDITDNIISVTGLTGDSGEKVVELTMAEYMALTSYTEDTTYIITDAPAIDLDNLATTGDLATKADKVSVTANTSEMKFPTWNNQGVITGCANVTVWVGTQAEYDLIATKDASTIYFVKQS